MSNKYLVICKSKLERIIRQDITKSTLELDWPHFINLDQGEISKTIITEGEQISTGFMYFLSAIIYFFVSLTYFIVCLSCKKYIDNIIFTHLLLLEFTNISLKNLVYLARIFQK